MSDVSAHAHGEYVSLSGYIVTGEGCFGTISWSVCDQLYALLPRNTRAQLLDGAAARVIIPYFTGLTERLLAQAGQESVDPKHLATDWSFQIRHVSCVFGLVDWQIGEGLWNLLPEDQRDALCDAADVLIHDFFGEKVYAPFLAFAWRQLGG